MNRITVSESFIEGFVEKAAEHKLTQDEVSQLYKIATYIAAGAVTSPHFQEGYDMAIKSSQDTLPSKLPAVPPHSSRLARIPGLGNLIADQNFLNNLNKQQQLNARHKTMTHLIKAYSGVPTMPAGMYGYGGMPPY